MLLAGEAEEKIRWRLKTEKDERLKLSRSQGNQEAGAARIKALKAYGQWVPYADKMGRGIFYYNKVLVLSFRCVFDPETFWSLADFLRYLLALVFHNKV